MKYEKPLPEWLAEGLEPPQSKKVEGWKQGDRPPAEWWNWQMNKTYEALEELQEKSATEQQLDGRVAPIENELTPNQKAPLALQEGIQAVNVLSNSALNVQFEGRTVVNLVPPFTSREWVLSNNTKIIDDTRIELYDGELNDVTVSVKPNTDYTLSVTFSGRIFIIDSDNNVIASQRKDNLDRKSVV